MNTFLKNNFREILTVSGILITGVFWVHTLTGIPPRVAKLEKSVEEINTQVIRNDTKIDVILEDTKFIKQLVTQRYSK